MPNIFLCFVWHMHQPLYKDLISGQYHLPWTRMHALKDYYGMVHVLEDFPDIHQTFNLVPSLMLQIEDYAAKTARDPFLDLALKPASELTPDEQSFILEHFFQANPARLIYRYPRYGELFNAWLAADRNPKRTLLAFGTAALRDLQLLSQLAWFDEEYIEGDAEVAALVQKGRDYSEADKILLGRKQAELIGKILPAYRKFAKKGQIEISTTPFYHPILPLLCDSDIASFAHPHVPLPQPFRYPQDAAEQLKRARHYCKQHFGKQPEGLWPSEGSVSDDALTIAAEAGFTWFATDNGVLARTLNKDADARITYRTYLWHKGKHKLHGLFRDHFLSDLIGFVYSRMEAQPAVEHFLERIRENCAPILASGEDAVVPIILDGENAWEYFARNGRPFLRELYRRIQGDRTMQALTVSEALQLVVPHQIGHIFPGSWIQANFDVWIGAEEDNRAWEYLLRARQTYDKIVSGDDGKHLSEAAKKLAYEELLIAEGSDWCWWYGPEHESTNRPEFDQLYREHLSNVYRALGLQPPAELSQPILKVAIAAHHEVPTGAIRPLIDGEETSYFEWMGAGLYRVDTRSGSMHGQRVLARKLYYGSDGENVYVRLDFEKDAVLPIEVRLQFDSIVARTEFSVRLTGEGLEKAEVPAGVELGWRKLLEIRAPLTALHAKQGQLVRIQSSVWQAGLPVDSVPRQGWIEVPTLAPDEWSRS